MHGEYRNTIDEKGRLMIPPKLREQLGTSVNLFLTKSIDNTLWLYTKEAFDELDNLVHSNPISTFGKSARIIEMFVLAPAREIELDKAGRLSIPQILREYAGLEPKTECVILGSKDKIEILSAKKHEELMVQFKAQVESAGDELSKMFGLGM
ncbi:MAG: division/cell wall cluster transcriptional repressor MraZ [Sphaerochaetaceae bacterium]|nr:division/cell wall cluster transcriptional repressor MraZ [Sphaerochaetaceae bacterium]